MSDDARSRTIFKVVMMVLHVCACMYLVNIIFDLIDEFRYVLVLHLLALVMKVEIDETNQLRVRQLHLLRECTHQCTYTHTHQHTA